MSSIATCTELQQQIREVNPSYYCFDSARLFEALNEVQVSPDTGEYYVTDVVQVLRKAGHGVSATITVPAEDARGINSRLDLAMVGRVMEDRIQLSLISEGVTIVDPDNTWIEADVTGGCDSVIYPFFLRQRWRDAWGKMPDRSFCDDRSGRGGARRGGRPARVESWRGSFLRLG